MRRVTTLVALASVLLALGWASATAAWNAHGHRTITRLALGGLPADAPAWLRDADTVAVIAEQSVEPDRWRGTRTPPLAHENGPDHYLDVDRLDQYGLSLATMPRFRYDYVRAMALAGHEHPERLEPYDRDRDPERQYEWPGFAAHAITEHYAKLRSSFNTLRILDEVVRADPSQARARAAQIDAARRNVVSEMGLLSHFVGDMAQPLHATKHHHGWVGDNPAGYTTDHGFHAYIDGTILEIHRLDADALRPAMAYDARVNGDDPWDDTVAYIGRTFEAVVPLYELQKSGELVKEPGRAFIASRLRAGASMLAALYAAAWDSSAPTDQQVAAFLRFNPVDQAGR